MPCRVGAVRETTSEGRAPAGRCSMWKMEDLQLEG